MRQKAHNGNGEDDALALFFGLRREQLLVELRKGGW